MNHRLVIQSMHANPASPSSRRSDTDASRRTAADAREPAGAAPPT